MKFNLPKKLVGKISYSTFRELILSILSAEDNGMMFSEMKVIYVKTKRIYGSVENNGNK